MPDASSNPAYPIPAELPRIVEGSMKQAIQQACELGERIATDRIAEWLRGLDPALDEYARDLLYRDEEEVAGALADAIDRGEHRD